METEAGGQGRGGQGRGTKPKDKGRKPREPMERTKGKISMLGTKGSDKGRVLRKESKGRHLRWCLPFVSKGGRGPRGDTKGGD